MAKDFEMGYLLDFYGEVLTPKQREMLNQYYNDDLSLSEIGENFGITRQGARDAIKHGETTLKELEAKVGFAARRAGTARRGCTIRVHRPLRETHHHRVCSHFDQDAGDHPVHGRGQRELMLRSF